MASAQKSRRNPKRRLEISGWTNLAIAASGWIAALFLGLLDLPAKINSFAEEEPKAAERVGNWLFVDKTLSGAWSNSPEGDVIAKRTDPELDALEGGPVDVELHVYRGEVEGTITSAGLGKRHVFSQIQVEGVASHGVIEATAWDAIDGEKATMAFIRFEAGERDGEAILIFTVVKQGCNIFPARAILWRTEAVRPGEVNSELLRHSTRKVEDQDKSGHKGGA